MIFTLWRCITPYLSQFSFSLTEANNVGKKRIFPAKKKKMLLLEWVMCTCLAALEGHTCEISVLWVVIIQGVQNPPCMGKGTQGYTLLMHNSSKNEEQISLYKRWAGITYFLSFLADACTWKGKALVFYFRRKKTSSSLAFSITLCVSVLAQLCAGYFFRARKQVVWRKRIWSSRCLHYVIGGGQSLCQRPDFQCRAQKLKRNPTLYWKMQSRRIVSRPFCSMVCSN